MHVRIRCLLALMLAMTTAAAAGVAFAADEVEEGFESLFDGKTLDGWEGEEKFWSVEDGAITGRIVKPIPANRFLIWRKGTVDDFELRLQYRVSEKGNSGINYRSKDLGDYTVSGYQADIDGENKYTGQLYEERGRKFLAHRGEKVRIKEDGEIEVLEKNDPEKLAEGIKANEWNDYTVIAKGNHLTHIINGRVMAEAIDDHEEGRSMSGVLAVQVHVGPPMVIQYRNIWLKRLKPEESQDK